MNRHVGSEVRVCLCAETEDGEQDDADRNRCINLKRVEYID